MPVRLVRFVARALVVVLSWLLVGGMGAAYALGSSPAAVVAPMEAVGSQAGFVTYSAYYGGVVGPDTPKAKCRGWVRWGSSNSLDLRYSCDVNPGSIAGGTLSNVTVTIEGDATQGPVAPGEPALPSGCSAQGSTNATSNNMTASDSLSVVPGCNASRVCFTLQVKRGLLSDYWFSPSGGKNVAGGTLPCAAVDLPSPPADVAPECPMFTVDSVPVAEPYSFANSFTRVSPKVTVTWKVPGLGTNESSQFLIYLLMDDGTIQESLVTGGSVATYSVGQTATYTGTVIQVSGTGHTVQAVGISFTKSGFRTYHTQQSTTTATRKVLSDSNFNTVGIYGGTYAPRCWFYWGNKLAATSTNDYDEPVGPMSPVAPGPMNDPVDVPEPAPSEDACTFDWNDPSTWLSGGMCAVVGLLGRLVRAVLGLPGEIIRLLGSALTGLFVPSESAFNDAVNRVKNAAGNGGAGEWSDAASGGFSGLSAVPGCAGPTVTLPPSWGSAGGSWQPINACAGTMATMANLSRQVLTVLVVLGGLGKGMAMVGEALGMSTSERVLGRPE